MIDTRPDFDHQLMGVADLMAARSTCSRLSVGAVLTHDTRIVSSGYNGAPAGHPHCVHVDSAPCSVAVHAEDNALRFAWSHAIPVARSTLYTTHAPCVDCATLIIKRQVGRVVYAETYRSSSGLNLLVEHHIPVTRLFRKEQR